MKQFQSISTLVAIKRLNILSLISTVLLGGSLIAIPPSQAIAAHPCYTTPNSGNCDGEDPQTAGCNADAYTVTSADIKTSTNRVVGRVDLRWSPKCKTNWARAVSHVGSTNMFVVLLNCNYQEIPETYFQLAGTTSIYGDMKYNTSVRARGAFGWNHISDTFGDTNPCY